MSDETLIRMLEEAAGKVPDSRPPIGTVLRHGHEKVRRRQAWIVGSAVAVVLVAGGGIVLGRHSGGGGSDATSSGVSTTTARGDLGRGQSTQASQNGQPSSGDSVQTEGPGLATAPAGTRWVGFEQVMVAVPSEWPMRAGQVCEDSQATYVTLLAGVTGTVNCADIPASAAGSDRLTLSSAAGQTPRALSCVPGVPQRCSATKLVDGVAIGFDSADQHARQIWKQLEGSITAVPEGYVAVPWTGGGTYVAPNVDDLQGALQGAGLPSAVDPGASGRDVTTDPEPGSVVPTGQPVTIVGLPTSSSPGRMDGRLVWSGGPVGTPIRPHQGTIHILGTDADGMKVDDFVPTGRDGRWSYSHPGGGTFTVTGTSTGYGLAGGTQDACVAGGPVHVQPLQTVTVTVTCSLK